MTNNEPPNLRGLVAESERLMAEARKLVLDRCGDDGVTDRYQNIHEEDIAALYIDEATGELTLELTDGDGGGEFNVAHRTFAQDHGQALRQLGVQRVWSAVVSEMEP